MADTKQALRDYAQAVEKDMAGGIATEHTYRPAAKTLLESFQTGIVATNEPKRIECGAPDFVVALKTRHGNLTVGYVETKDVGSALVSIERDSERANPTSRDGLQLKKYRAALPNLILTDFLEFRRYAGGELREVAELGRISKNRLQINKDGLETVSELLTNFVSAAPESIARPQELAQRMARLSHIIRDIIAEAFAGNRASNLLTDLRQALEQTLIPDLSESDFADMFSQTLAYGLFAARVNHSGPQLFQRQNADTEIPRTNPFLRRLFTTMAGPDLDDEPFVGFVDDLAQLLAHADMEAVLSDFGKRAARQDPVLHFYETFLAAYNPEMREKRGVYYTPEPVVSYIVRSVDYLLRTRFHCPQGLADTSKIQYAYRDEQQRELKGESHRVLILDPACGTGTFLYSVIDQVREEFRKAGNAGAWRGFVKAHLIKRLFGFELLMAPYAIAHLKLGMQLAAQDLPDTQRRDWAYDLSQDERLKVYLTNTLEEAELEVHTLIGQLRIITEEANAAASVKRDLPIMVVLGNPPYSGHSANASWREVRDAQTGRSHRELTWIGKLLQDYYHVDGKPLGEKNPKWLQDDYVKFIRFGQWRIQQTPGGGILAFITNHGYLDNPTFRGMRQQLMNTFSDIYLLNLHGNSNKKERTPEGGLDQNVFDIQQGVTIGIFVKTPGMSGPATVHYADLWGVRPEKYSWLDQHGIDDTVWAGLSPASPDYLFIPQNKSLHAERQQGWKLTDIMPVNSVGIVTARDELTIHWTRGEIWNTLNDFAALPEETARAKYELGQDARDWKVTLAQEDLKRSGPIRNKLTPILYRPFDVRYTYYTGYSRGFICMPRPEVMWHMRAGSNLGLMATRQTRDVWDVLATSNIIGHKALSAYDITSLFPVYLYPRPADEPGKQIEMPNLSPWPEGKDGRTPNFTRVFIEDVEHQINLKFVIDGMGDLQNTFGPEDVFNYIYAVFHAPGYRRRYSEFLKQDFPRVPLTDDLALFRALVKYGAELVKLHLLESPALQHLTTRFPVVGDNVVEKGQPRYLAPGEPEPGSGKPVELGRVYIGKDDPKTGKRGQYFDNVPPEVWEFQIGGYQPLDKWLKDRRGRQLAYDDLIHYQRIVKVMSETIHIMGEIDEVIEEHGGWPLPTRVSQEIP